MARKDLRIAAWNSNGLFNHKNELQVFLDTQKIYICLISETHFTKQSYIKFRGYTTNHTIHPQNTARGGSAVIIKENITHHEEPKYETAEIQATAVTIMTNGSNLTIAGIYCPPRHNLKEVEFIKFFKT